MAALATAVTMPDTAAMRLFAAIKPSVDVREKVRAMQARLMEMRADIRWVALENFHITVKFFGDVDAARVPELLERIQKAAAQVPAFPLEIEGINRFPEKGAARVIICRVISPDQRMVKLHRLIDSAAGGMGLPMDTRVLVPHMTLGRVSSNGGINKLLRLIEKHDLDFFGSFAVERAELVESFLGADEEGSARYAVVGAAPMAALPPAQHLRP
jgi:2'-5' RNA ligase